MGRHIKQWAIFMRQIQMHKQKTSSSPKVAFNSEILAFLLSSTRKKSEKNCSFSKSVKRTNLTCKNRHANRKYVNPLKRGKKYLCQSKHECNANLEQSCASSMALEADSCKLDCHKETNQEHNGGNFNDSQTRRSQSNDKSSSKELAFWEEKIDQKPPTRTKLTCRAHLEQFWKKNPHTKRKILQAGTTKTEAKRN